MDLSSANKELWSFILTSGILAILLLFANLLRRKVKFFRNTLAPTSVIAGFIGLIINETGLINIDTSLLHMLTYHGLAIGFIALSLRVPRIQDIKKQKGDGIYNGVNSGMLIVSNYLMQGALGMIITIIASLTFAPQFFKASGILLPMGYGQGPGQGNNIGAMYESYGFTGGQNFGLAIASIGFVWASIGGIAYLYYLKKKGKLPETSLRHSGEKAEVVFQEEDEVPLSEPIDRLTLQVALIVLVYLMTYGVIYGLLWVLGQFPALSGLVETLTPLLWGFNFLFASVIALLLRGSLNKFRQKGWMSRQYPNTYLLNRISGFAFDVMIVGAIATISIDRLKENWLVFLILTTLGGLATLFYNIKMSKIVYPDYPVAGMMGMYGMMTGTASIGIMLLREVDPLFRTPMSMNLVTGSSTAIIFAAPILLFVGFAVQSELLTYISLGAICVYWAILHFSLKYRSKKHALRQAKTEIHDPED
ncbi:MAG: sodium:glutamate symporter [Fastidiosipila sp.]|nr:sodium:glutamate symporter [Fastidiosipila sp.]